MFILYLTHEHGNRVKFVHNFVTSEISIKYFFDTAIPNLLLT